MRQAVQILAEDKEEEVQGGQAVPLKEREQETGDVASNGDH